MDPDLSLIDFGKRYYDPDLGRWLSVDPAGFINCYNLYQYNFNNPFSYTDPDGQFVFLIPLLCGSFGIGALGTAAVVIEITTVQAVIGTLVTGAAIWGISEGLSSLDHAINERRFRPYMHQDNTADEEAKKKEKNKWRSKREYTHTYAPSRPLPHSENGVHAPDVDVPHTQLGTNQSENGKFPQAREYGKDGELVRDIDFTDHGRPNLHANPHQHYMEQKSYWRESCERESISF